MQDTEGQGGSGALELGPQASAQGTIKPLDNSQLGTLRPWLSLLSQRGRGVWVGGEGICGGWWGPHSGDRLAYQTSEWVVNTPSLRDSGDIQRTGSSPFPPFR